MIPSASFSIMKDRKRKSSRLPGRKNRPKTAVERYKDYMRAKKCRDHNVTAILSVKDRNYSSQMEAAIGQLEDLEQATGSSSTSVTKMGAAFGAAAQVVESAMSAVSGCVGDAIKRFDTLRQFPKVMQQIGFSAEDANKATEKTDGWNTGSFRHRYRRLRPIRRVWPC